MAEPKAGPPSSADDQKGRPQLESVTSRPIQEPLPPIKTGQSEFIRFMIPFLIALALAAILFGPVAAFLSNIRSFQTTDDAYVHGRKTVIASKIGGVVTQVLFDDNANVKKGDVLARLDTREFDHQLKQLQAELTAAKALFDSARKELERGEFDIVVKRRQNELLSATALYQEAKSDLDRGEFDNVVKRRQHELDSANALLQEARRELERGEFDNIVKRRQNEILSATALLEETKRSLDRVTELQKKGLVSQKELETATAVYQDHSGKVGALKVQLKEAQQAAEKAHDAAVANFENHSGKVRALQIQLKEAQLAAERARDSALAHYKNSFGKQQANEVQLKEALIAAEKVRDVAVANYHTTLAKVWSIQAQIDQVMLNIEYATIKAPADGTVGRRQIEPNTVIRAAQSITTFIDSQERWVVANFKETQLQEIRIGQPVEIEIDAIHGPLFRGTVQSISPGSGATFAIIPPDNATGNFTKIVQRVPVKIELAPESVHGYESLLVPGLSAIVKVRIRGDNRKH